VQIKSNINSSTKKIKITETLSKSQKFENNQLDDDDNMNKEIQDIQFEDESINENVKYIQSSDESEEEIADNENVYESNDEEEADHSEYENDFEDLEDDNMGSPDSKAKSSSKPSSKSSLYKIPTNDEIHALKDTSELFKSNIFKLQMDELLSEVRLNFDKIKPLETVLHQIRSKILGLTDIEELPLNEAINKMKSQGIEIPFPEVAPSKTAKYKLAFKTPSVIRVVGSLLLRTITKTRNGFNVDLAVEMPKVYIIIYHWILFFLFFVLPFQTYFLEFIFILRYHLNKRLTDYFIFVSLL